MDAVMAGQGAGVFALCVAVTLFAGFVKGTVGFAMPLIMIAAFSAFLPPEVALSGLILPTLFTNLSQAFRDGVAAALDTAWTYWRFLAATLALIPVSAHLVDDIPRAAFLLLLGVPLTVYAGLLLAGRSLAIRLQHRVPAEWLLGVAGGLYGGVAGVWGPPLMVLLLSVATPKALMVRAQGVVFLLGAVMLTAAHLGTGVLNAGTLPFSAVLVVPALAGLMLGYRLGDRLDEARFRWWTHVLLVVTGLNLVRMAWLGWQG
ncbi:MAG: sulfite exporter TauE/SafE family protein [Gemmobacter sp.]